MALILGLVRGLFSLALWTGSLVMLTLLALNLWDMAQDVVASGGFIRY